MNHETGYKTGSQPYRYGCKEYSLEMQLLQLKKQELQVTDPRIKIQLAERIAEIENQLGM